MNRNYIVLDFFNPEIVNVICDEDGATKYFDTYKDAVDEADYCQDGRVISLNYTYKPDNYSMYKEKFIALCKKLEEIEYIHSPEYKISGGYLTIKPDKDNNYNDDDAVLYAVVTYGIQDGGTNKRTSYDIWMDACLVELNNIKNFRSE